MRVLVLGPSGMLGHDLVAGAPLTVELVKPAARLDITKHDEVDRALDALRPAYVVNAAGYTAVDRAEEEPEVANAVNGTAVAHLAAACGARGITLVHFSSDYVFSGRASRPYREDDAREPTGAYARSKLLGEQGIEASRVRALVIRTQWLFGVHGRSFPRTMLDRARARLPTRVVNDQVGRPTYTRDLAGWTWQLIERGLVGTIHAANNGTASWFDVARRVFERAGALDCLSSCATSEYPLPAKRPAFSVLDIGRLTAEITEVLPWTDALDRFLGELETATRDGRRELG